MPNFNPERLREIRVIRKMTLDQLATNLGVTKQAISKYEHGKSIPSSETISKMLSVLNVPRQYFTKDSIVLNNNNTALFFRTSSTTTETQKTFADFESKWGYEILLGIGSFEDIPNINIPSFDDNLSIPEKAKYLRQYWNLGIEPIENMITLLERNGIFVFMVNSSELNTDAYSRIINGIPVIVLNEYKGTPVRWRFSLAHELGHLVLHPYLSQTEIELRAKTIESEASLFASSFLLPADSFGQSIVSLKLDHFLELKKEWKVSLAAMFYNCVYFEIINDQQYKALQKQLSKKGWHKSEPYDDEIEFERPMFLYNQSKKYLTDRNSFEQFNSIVRLPYNDVELLCSLPNGYFSDYYDMGLILEDNVLENEQLSLF